MKPGEGLAACGFGLFPVRLLSAFLVLVLVLMLLGMSINVVLLFDRQSFNFQLQTSLFLFQVQQQLLLSAPPHAMTWGGGGCDVQWELVVASARGALLQLRGVKAGKARRPLQNAVDFDT